MENECTVCGNADEISINSCTCTDCKFLFTGKTDDGRFYNCDNPEYYEVTKRYEVKPDFGCVYFEKGE